MLTRIILFLLTAALSLCVSAAPRIDILIPTDNPNLGDLAKAMQHSLRQLQPDLEIAIRNNADPNTEQTHKSLAIAVGDGFLPWAVSNKNTYAATISFYVGSSQYNAANYRGGKVTALYRDQPLLRQLQLAKLLLPNLSRVAVIYGSEQPPRELAEFDDKSGFAMQAVSIRNETNWAKLLSQLMIDNDILLGIDDSAVYNSDMIRSILLTTYRRGKILIGPSRPFVTAGSLASTYTSSEQYLQQLRAMVRVYLQQGKLPAPEYPKFFRIAINQQVANSLGLNLPDEKTLHEQMPQQTGECGDDC